MCVCEEESIEPCDTEAGLRPSSPSKAKHSIHIYIHMHTYLALTISLSRGTSCEATSTADVNSPPGLPRKSRTRPLSCWLGALARRRSRETRNSKGAFCWRGG